MKLIIQIPCYNERQTLPATMEALPTAIPGIDTIERMVIDDVSIDGTAETACRLGVEHIVRFSAHRGLARAFAAGLDAALALGADIIVNTDADNQYDGGDIPALVAPILEGRAEMVVGARDIGAVADFSPAKKLLQRIGSAVVRRISGTAVPDVTSGFRALSREAALRMHVLSDFSYTLETVIQAGAAGMAITHVPVHTNPKTRASRLAPSTFAYLYRSVATIVRISTMYKPMRVFTTIGMLILLFGMAGVGRFLYFYFSLPDVQTGHIQSLVVASALLMIGFQVLLYGLVADIIAKNRMLVEDILLRARRQEAAPHR